MYDDGGYAQDHMLNYSYSQDFNTSDDEHGDDKIVSIFVGLDINLDHYDNVGYAGDDMSDID